jgi:RNA polymerase sigma-70 factor (ECF subfamily)
MTGIRFSSIVISFERFFRCDWYDIGSRLAVAFFSFCQPQKKCNRWLPELVLPIGAHPHVSQNEDQSDVDKVLAGEVSAYEGIVRRWQGPLVNLAYRFCRDRGRAEELAQEAFLRAYRALGQWRRDATFSTWLFALATNLYRTELRRIPAGLVPLENLAELRDSRAPDGGLESEDRDRAVRRAVFSLPAKYREALLLFYFHEMDIPAAARSLGLPEGTVKARLSRGREILRGKLADAIGQPRLREA